jgi:hypothetical protein
MFKILGADQKEYGPVTTDVLRQWITQGRANASTQVQAAGTAEWKPLSAFPEFADALAFGLKPPPLSGGASALAAPAGPAKTSGMAVASLVLGILGFCGITALAGIVLGIIAQIQITKSNGRLKGSGLAIAGICVSGLMLFLIVPASLLLPALARAKAKAQAINCVSHMKQISLAIRMYANDYKDNLPLANTWCDVIQPNLGAPKVMRCPADPAAQSSYAYNAALSGKNLDKVSPQTVMIFECPSGWNVSGGPERMVSHHPRLYVVGLADGSVMQVSPAQLSTLRWNP